MVELGARCAVVMLVSRYTDVSLSTWDQPSTGGGRSRIGYGIGIGN